MCLTVFCINSINIYAGINGLEVGQSIVVAIFSALYSVLCLNRKEEGSPIDEHAAFLSFICSVIFIAVSVPLYSLNKFLLLVFNLTSRFFYLLSVRYPAKIFVGDTFTHWSGGVLASIGLLGRFPMVFLFFPVSDSLYSPALIF